MADRTTLKSYFQTRDTPTQAQFAELINSTVNITDDHYTPTVEAALASTQFGAVSIDCSLGTGFYLDLIDQNVTIGAPSNVVDGQLYTLVLKQSDSGNDFSVAFHSSFKQSTAGTFVMATGTLSVSTVRFYSSNGTLYLFPQTNFAP